MSLEQLEKFLERFIAPRKLRSSNSRHKAVTIGAVSSLIWCIDRFDEANFRHEELIGLLAKKYGIIDSKRERAMMKKHDISGILSCCYYRAVWKEPHKELLKRYGYWKK